MVTVSSPLWSHFLTTMRNSSSLIHIKLDNTSFFMDLVFLKTNWVHIFLCYLWFKSFPVLLLVLISISCFNFILVWFNIGFGWSIIGGFQTEEQAKQFAHLSKFSQGMRNQGIISHGVRIFAHPTNQIRTPNENKPTPTKYSHTLRTKFAYPNQFRILCETQRGMRSNFAPLKSFHALCETQEAPTKMKSRPPISF